MCLVRDPVLERSYDAATTCTRSIRYGASNWRIGLEYTRIFEALGTVLEKRSGPISTMNRREHHRRPAFQEAMEKPGLTPDPQVLRERSDRKRPCCFSRRRFPTNHA